jgi:hypothetical protein
MASDNVTLAILYIPQNLGESAFCVHGSNYLFCGIPTMFMDHKLL